MEKCILCGLKTDGEYDGKSVCDPCKGKYGKKLSRAIALKEEGWENWRLKV